MEKHIEPCLNYYKLLQPAYIQRIEPCLNYYNLYTFDQSRNRTYTFIFLDIFSSRAWIFICWTSMVSALRRRINKSWLPIHRAKMVLFIRTWEAMNMKSGDFLSMGLMTNFRLWKVMFLISDHGKPILGVNLGREWEKGIVLILYMFNDGFVSSFSFER